MIAQALQHRSGRIIALCRLTLAALFILALWLEPTQPVRDFELSYTLLTSYLVVAFIMLITVWHKWWVDYILAKPVFLLDVLVFLAAIYFTESADDNFTSPFIAFFAFLMLVSTIRWNWRTTAFISLAICILYIFVGLLMQFWAVEFDAYRFSRRIAFMIVLSLVAIWIGLERRSLTVPRFSALTSVQKTHQTPLAAAAEYACKVTNAQCAAICWRENEETVIKVYRFGSLGIEQKRLSSEQLSCTYIQHAILFDQRGIQLYRSAEGSYLTQRDADIPWLAAYFNITDGVAAPLISSAGKGQLVLFDIPGLCIDDLALTEATAHEIAAAFDRQALSLLAHQGAVQRERESIARDLHDSVAQSLSAAAYRLEGLRSWIKAGNNPDPEITDLKKALHSEQQHIRGLISGLRLESKSVADQVALDAELQRLVVNLARFWQVDVTLDTIKKENLTPLYLSHEVQQIVREAVANAVRHGGSKSIDCKLSYSIGSLHLVIGDNGSGIGIEHLPTGPRSIRDRLDTLAGTMQIETNETGTKLQITIPYESTL